MTVQITISPFVGSDLTTFNLYSNVTGLTTNPFEIGVTLNQLINGYISSLVPNGTTTIRVQATGVCNTYVDKTVGELEAVIFEADTITNVNFLSINSPLLGFYIFWGDGAYDYYPAGNYSSGLTHNYSSPFTGQVKIASADLSQITLIWDSSGGAVGEGFVGTNMTVATSELFKLSGCTDLRLLRISALGTAITLPRNIEFLRLWAATNLSGNVSELPPLLNNSSILGFNTLTGDIKDLPRANVVNGVLYAINGNNTLYGDIKDLPYNTSSTVVDYIEIQGNNTVTGDLVTLPRTYSYVYISGGPDNNHSDPYGNTIYGDIGDLPAGMTQFWLKGDNTITGDLATVPTTLVYFYVRGLATITGEVTDMPCPNLVQITIINDNPPILNTTLDFNSLGNLPDLTSIYLDGGVQTISGNLSSLPIGIIYATFYGSDGNVIGTLADLTNNTGLKEFTIAPGSNSNIGGDVDDLPSSITRFWLNQQGGTGTAAVTTYSGATTHTWATEMTRFTSICDTPFDATVNDLLVDFKNVSWKYYGNFPPEISIYASAPLSPTGAAAKTYLESNNPGLTVTITT